MATDDSLEKTGGDGEPRKKAEGGAGPRKRLPLSPMTKKRLEKAFEHATKQVSQDNIDYATELLSQCAIGDPGNIEYVRGYVENLQKKYKNNRKGAPLAQFKERGARGALKKAEGQQDWEEVIQNGLKILGVNPWDVPALRSLATASYHAGDFECELYYLKRALESNPKDADTNIQCANAMAARNQWDQAIACWHRVEQMRPDDDDVQRAISDLTLRKTLPKSAQDDAEHKKHKGPAKPGGAQQADELSEEEILKQKIGQQPNNLANYLELAQIYINGEKYAEAEDLYVKAFEISKGDDDIRERWTDVQVRRLRHKVTAARSRRKESPETEQEYRRLRKELVDKELERCKFLCKRYPNNLRFKFDLGVQYQYARQYSEAIKEFQQAKNDPRCKGLCMLGLGQCFQTIKQGRLAMQHYGWAVEEIPDRDAVNKKEALYLAGKMALEDLKDVDTAEKYLTILAGLDFSYKDVSALLDKVAQVREDPDGGADGPK